MDPVLFSLKVSIDFKYLNYNSGWEVTNYWGLQTQRKKYRFKTTL